jgi:hypothetical protein
VSKQAAKTKPYLCQCACTVVLDFIVAHVQLSKLLRLSAAQAPADDDGTVVGKSIATQVQLQDTSNQYKGCYMTCYATVG